MKATSFEYRHQLVLHEVVVGAALLTYALDRDDIIWRFVKGSAPGARFLERWLFAAATLLFGVSAAICTVAHIYPRPGLNDPPANFTPVHWLRWRFRFRQLGDYLYALALGSLVPLSGFLVLAIGEGIRLFRLSHGNGAPILGEPADDCTSLSWTNAIRQETLKWGLFLSMIVFTVTLRDRIGEVLIAATVLLSVLLNFFFARRLRHALPP
jgi:hypothetical protein